ncbi:VOC family protein [Streptomyces sp. NBC_00237]|uniref:VOC family protein n=1 Tax=Streptomyces sp. NBC_00237 TaxID=2975687 RepID=UPI00225B281D|nr:VOC family protein [Streptomyces sp. NBC_00237]MCX5206368.1 VOC family protein [Streptomyces sp. NBC_00237]
MGRTTHITQVATIAIHVTDQQKAVEFYVGELGFEVRRDAPFGEGRWIEVAPPGATTTVALVLKGIPAGIRLTTRDADADHAELGTRGVDTDAEVLRMGPSAPPMFTVRDPDGNTLILVEGS